MPVVAIVGVDCVGEIAEGPGEADHMPTGIALVAAIDRVGKIALVRQGVEFGKEGFGPDTTGERGPIFGQVGHQLVERGLRLPFKRADDGLHCCQPLAPELGGA